MGTPGQNILLFCSEQSKQIFKRPKQNDSLDLISQMSYLHFAEEQLYLKYLAVLKVLYLKVVSL